MSQANQENLVKDEDFWKVKDHRIGMVLAGTEFGSCSKNKNKQTKNKKKKLIRNESLTKKNIRKKTTKYN